MNEFVIFVVEDDPIYGEMLEYRLRMNPDYVVYRYTRGKECLANLHLRPAVITLDYSLPDMNGKEVLKKVREQFSEIEILIISSQDDISTAITLLKEGAYDYIEKNQDTQARLWNTIVKIRENQSLRGEVENLREKLADKYSAGKTIIGQSPAISHIHSLIERASKTNINVSINGETGT
jgi:two-component system, NtrC family, response regulator AtoC